MRFLAILIAALVVSEVNVLAQTAPSSALTAALGTGKATYLPFDDFANGSFRYDSDVAGFAFAKTLDLNLVIDSADNKAEIPERVTYIQDPKVQIKQIQELLKSFINDGQIIFDKSVIVGPRLTEKLRTNPIFSQLSQVGLALPFRTNGKDEIVFEKRLSSSPTIKLLAAYIRSLYNHTTEIHARKLNRYELDWYWSLISYDIIEPIYILESKDCSLVVHFQNNQIFFVDDWSGITWKKGRL